MCTEPGTVAGCQVSLFTSRNSQLRFSGIVKYEVRCMADLVCALTGITVKRNSGRRMGTRFLDRKFYLTEVRQIVTWGAELKLAIDFTAC